MSPIGFIGIGIMGKGMLKNLVAKVDSHYVIWNRSRAVCEEMVVLFPSKVTIASTPAEVVRQCDVTYSMLSTLEASAAVYDEPVNGVIAGVTAGKLVVDCATLSPERMIDQAQRISAKGGRFLEAPVSGSKAPAETGTLIFLCGGEPEVYESQAACLDAMGKAKFLMGPVGQGTKLKLVVNMIMGSMMGAFAEGMTLAKGADLPLETLLQVLDLGAMSNPMFKGKGPNMISGNFAPNFPLKHQQKDMKLALCLAEQSGVTLPTTEAANAAYLKAMEEGKGDEDFCAVISAYPTKK
eukprot:CAMPEP_0170403746 /NCGR_PEP_ID=MMETSP0117_2-20130122/26264_1 /TAXON_ID=400756 /ORGANISM="Durinskia baltica, Strain CSIRO CS-38" /LENGTH=294 /DNA_ID=CAMNT_0010660719 /DNA_START=57 /DNA_END=941 /DNA_ORIENTATION=+